MSNKKTAILTKATGIFLLFTFALVGMAAVTQIDLVTQVKNTLAIGNGGTGQSSFAAGILRSSGSALSSAELSGDATTSGSNAVTVAKVNGTSVPTTSTADQLLLTTASATGAWKSIPNCTAGAIQYTVATHAISCGTVLTGSFADAEVPTGTINGVNDTFTVANAPSPAGSLALYKNGQLMIAGGSDYTLTTNSIVFVAGAIPQTGDVLTANYRY
jgi:hypothetical protein